MLLKALKLIQRLHISAPEAAGPQFGALPYTIRDGQLVVLLITSRGRGKWIFPKGGLVEGMTPHDSAAHEAWEEAGLQPAQLTGLQAGRVLNIACDIREGWQHEWLYAYDLALPSGLLPVNQDGEVAEHRLWPIDQALAFAAEGRMTMDASLATLDFALRHALLPADEAAELAPRLAALCVTPEAARRFDPPIA